MTYTTKTTMEYVFRKATIDEQDQIWSVLEDAIARRKNEGSDQWPLAHQR